MIAFLSGRYKEIERALEYEMRLASAEQRFEDAARERNRLRSIRSLLERQRVAHEGAGSLDAIAVAVSEGRGQRAGLPGPRRRPVRPPELLSRQRRRRGPATVAEAFILQYYASAMSVPPLLVVQREVGANPALAEALTAAPRRHGGDPGRRAG